MIKPIETQYKGYRFRSRLEARWAVFFDTLGVKWEYEPEGFDLGEAGWYLPDFRVTSPQGMVTWYEVKPQGVTSDMKFSAFKCAIDARADTTQAALLSGDPTDVLGEEPETHACPRCGSLARLGSISSLLSFVRGDGEDSDGMPRCGTLEEVGIAYGCWACDVNTPVGGGHPLEMGLAGPVQPNKGLVEFFDVAGWRSMLRQSANAARAVRFGKGGRG